MRKLSIVCLILSAFSVPSPAQEFARSENFQSEKAEKIDEFGQIDDCDFGARLDHLMVALQEKTGATGYLIFYQGKDVLPARYESSLSERRARNHVMLRRFDSSRLVFVNGGFREEQGTEIWIVPAGAEPPMPTGTIPKPEIPTGKTFLYDRNLLSGGYEGDFTEEFILPSVKARQEAERLAYEAEMESVESESEEVIEETPDEPETLSVEEETETDQRTPEEIEAEKFSWANEKFGEVIKKQKAASGVMIFYADDSYYDISRIHGHIEDGKRRIAEAAKISPGLIQVVFGGYRSGIEVEYFVVPKNGAFPAAKPEERPVEEIEDEETEEVSP